EIWAKEKTEQPFMNPEEFSEALQDILGDEDDWEEDEDE
ncbi:MAG: cell division/cell wall cluster transcriptional repressor MraZ, partial [Bacteroides oleiciplenus]|nr:cell division/cell wall cluster transcriptional repressor MraZ [Bacteroides oleiciplenus]